MAGRFAVVAAALLGLGLGALAVALLEGREPSSPAAVAAAPPGRLADEIAALRAALEAERAARSTLATELAWLREDVERLGAAGVPEALDSPTQPAPSAPEVGAGGGKAERARRGEPWFDEAPLLERGLEAAEVARLRDTYEAAQMQELYLIDQAQREGWRGSPRFFRQLANLRNGVRGEIGDQDYDLVLYATGRNNRIAVQDLLDTSPAADSGLRAGDLLLSYDGERIFDIRELKRLTTQGKPGSSTAVDLVREGEELRVYVPRGPLGIRLRAERRAPETAG